MESGDIPRARGLAPVYAAGRRPVLVPGEITIRAMASRKAVGPDGLPVELQKILTDEGDFGHPA